jgi:thioredoxin 1
MTTGTIATDATFDEVVLQSDKTVVVDFWADWCGPCRALSPILDEIGREHADTIEIVKINADDNPEAAMEYRVMSIPMLKVFRGGEVVKTVRGAYPKVALEKTLAEYL